MPQDTFDLTANVKSEPFRDDPANADAMYAAIGRALVLWGKLEFHFYSLICIIWNLPGAEQARATRKNGVMPISMKQRAEFCKVAFKTMKVLEREKDQFLSILSRIMDGAEDRSMLFHSACNGFVGTDPLTIQLIHHKHKGGKLLHATFPVTIEQINKLAENFDSLNLELIATTWNVACLQDLKASPTGGIEV